MICGYTKEFQISFLYLQVVVSFNTKPNLGLKFYTFSLIDAKAQALLFLKAKLTTLSTLKSTIHPFNLALYWHMHLLKLNVKLKFKLELTLMLILLFCILCTDKA